MLASICSKVVDKSKDFETLATCFESVDLSQVELAHEINQGHAFSTQHNGRRKAENFVAAGYIALDFDGGIEPDVVLGDPLIQKYHSIFYHTPSSTPANPRFRIVFELENPIHDADHYREYVLAFLWRFGSEADQSTKDATRFFYGAKGSEPTFTGSIMPMSVVASISGEYRQHLKAEREKAEAERRAAQPVSTANDKGKLKYLEAVLQTHVDLVRNAPKGTRHNTARASARVIGGYLAGEPGILDEYQVEQSLIDAKMSMGADLKESSKVVRAGLDEGKRQPLYIPDKPVTSNQGSNYPAHFDDVPLPDEAIEAAPTNPPAPKEKRKRLWKADELVSFPKPEWLVEGQIVRNSLCFLVGEPGSKKTFLALDIALREAQNAPVVYVAGEAPAGFHQRIEAWRQYHKPTACNFYLWTDELHPTDPNSVKAFLAEIAEIGQPSLIVIDTLARAAVGLDENSARDMGLLVAGFDKLKAATGATVMAVHHTGKNGAGERGSSALRGAADTMLRVFPEGDGALKLVCDKQKDSEEFEPIYYKWEQVANSLVLLPTTAGDVTSGDKLGGNAKAVLEVLAYEIFENRGAGSKQLQEALGRDWSSEGKRAAMYKILNQLKRLGYITQGAKGEPYILTVAGRDVIAPQNL